MAQDICRHRRRRRSTRSAEHAQQRLPLLEGGPRWQTTGEPILEVRDLVKHFPLTQGILFKKQIGAVKAVDGVSFDLDRGETLGIVGESGCGKSTWPSC